MSTMSGARVPFYKLQGCGNDFVAMDNRVLRLPQERMAEWARRVCPRAFGVGADGLFFLEPAPAGSGADARWHFYNADGSRAEMCGNASRCAGRLIHSLGMAGERHVLLTDAGPVAIAVDPAAGLVKVQLTAPRDLAMGITVSALGHETTVHCVNTGVPHAVVLVDDVDEQDVAAMGRALRFHERFAPAGTNVNFVQVLDRSHTRMRTYERGVEAETYACGTGACAVQVVLHALGMADAELANTTTGGEVLTTSLEGGRTYLKGAAELTFSGELNADALGLPLS
ncbi:diaminopimelate epimerase [Humidesulfovibrio mexicanus]|uniref:Diaminopimelate epimerase n=2 Tax=Humidesulfovibrio mexicanus TaxID=147047 RepID=A0A239BSC9_9BACT|nr:diaminopimelate epimerase [Humidesulfovibrio mexicanus]